jgi:DNA-3-methyladenine glycosylase I
MVNAKNKWFPDDTLHQKYYPDNPLYKHYQDDVWGIPPHNDESIFEQYTIGIFAAGLNWNISFLKYPLLTAYYHNWHFDEIVKMTPADIGKMLQDQGLIRNKRKMLATIDNARLVLKIQRRFGSLDNYFWSMVNYKQEVKDVYSIAELGTTSPTGNRIAKRMKKDGFKYAGPVSVYSFLISIGIITARLDGKGIEKYPVDKIVKYKDQGVNTFNVEERF